jgi:hypothetical protein
MPRFLRRNYDSSLRFNGSSNYVTLGTSGSIAQASSAFSVACWVKLNASSSGLIFTPVGDITGSLNRFYFQISDNKITSYVKTDATSASLPGSSVIPLNAWVHLVMTYDGANVRTYINAALDQTVVCTGTCTASVSGMAIGRGFAGTRYHNGNVARVQYWNARALSLAEIQSIYFNGADSYDASIRSGMTGEWKLDEWTGTTAIDSVGGNNGTITGATYVADVPFKSEFIQRNANAAILANGADGAAGNILSIPFSATLNPTAAVTVEIWFRPTALKAGILFDNSTVGLTNSYFLSMGANGSMSWFSTIGGLSKNIVGTAKKAKFFEWNCVSATYNGSAVLIFLNGSQLAETLAASGALGTNSGPLRIGAYFSGGISATFQGNLSQPRVYAAGCTLAEHQDRYYRSITSTALQAGLVLDLNTQLGAGSTVTDLSGLGNHATMGASASWTSDSPFKSRKASVNANMVKNGDFEYAPPFTAATTTGTRYVDGTSGGSTTNSLFGWKHQSGAGPYSVRFDPTVSHSGGSSLLISASDVLTSTYVDVGIGIAASKTVSELAFAIPITPSTDYLLTGYIKTTNVPTDGAYLQFTSYDAAGTRVNNTASTTKVSGTADWTLISQRFTAGTTARFATIGLMKNVAGNVSDAWFDDITLTPVYPEGRVPANGNLVKNFDFEVVPTFVAATTTGGRWVDGTSGGSTTNSTYKWAINTATGTVSSQFDSSTSNTGTGSLKLSTLATGSNIIVKPLVSTTVATLQQFSAQALPSTSYTFTFWMKTTANSGDSNSGGFVQLLEYNAAGSNTTTTNSTMVKTTTGWTQYSVVLTTAASTNYIVVTPRVDGNTGAATLIMDAWFDDIYLAPTTNPGRIAIT